MASNELSVEIITGKHIHFYLLVMKLASIMGISLCKDMLTHAEIVRIYGYSPFFNRAENTMSNKRVIKVLRT